MAGRYSPKRIVVCGLICMLSGEVLLIAFTGPDLRTVGFALALALVGAGNGLLVSQLGNVIMSSVPAERGSEAGGLQGTAMNLGASLGVALVGSILIASLVGNFQKAVLADPALAAVAPELTAQAEQNANFASVEQVTAAAEAGGAARSGGRCRHRAIRRCPDHGAQGGLCLDCLLLPAGALVREVTAKTGRW